LRYRGGAVHTIRKTIVHPDYQERIVYYDIGLLFLDEPFTITPKLLPICLPDISHSSLPSSLINTGIVVQGWGKDENEEQGKSLTQIYVSIRSKNDCNYLLTNNVRRLDALRIKEYLPDLTTDSMFCADSILNPEETGTCNGDSGGPALIRNFKDGLYVHSLVGIVQGGIACGSKFPDFYTDVANDKILPWIKQAIKL